MGLTYNVYLNADKIFGCRECKAHLADYNDIVSRVRLPLSLTFLRKIAFVDSRRTSAANTAKPSYSNESSTSRKETPSNAT